MARIRVSPEQMHQVANQFQQASTQTQQTVANLQKTINGLQGEWEGMASQRFYGEFQQCQGSMRQFVELLTGIAQQLHQIADRFAASDQG